MTYMGSLWCEFSGRDASNTGSAGNYQRNLLTHLALILLIGAMLLVFLNVLTQHYLYFIMYNLLILNLQTWLNFAILVVIYLFIYLPYLMLFFMTPMI